MDQTKQYTITHEFWNFVEKYIPDFPGRKDFIRQGDLQFFIDGQESTVTGLTQEEARKEQDKILLNIFGEAIHNYTQAIAVKCEYCNTEQTPYCSKCGKKQIIN